MPSPVIDPVSDVQDHARGEDWGFALAASNSPTSWTISLEPPGFSFNTTTGALAVTGADTINGFWNLVFYAINGDGTSAPVTVPFKIYGAGFTNGPAVDLTFDQVTRLVQAESILATPAQPAAAEAEAAGVAQSLSPILIVKSSDGLLCAVRYTKGLGIRDADVTSAKFSFKEIDGDPVVVESTAWKKVGSGSSTYYLIYGALSGTALESAIENKAKDAGSYFDAICSIVIVEDNDDTSGWEGTAPTSIRTESQNFRVRVYRQNAA